jgi:hypothetical protein
LAEQRFGGLAEAREDPPEKEDIARAAIVAEQGGVCRVTKDSGGATLPPLAIILEGRVHWLCNN